MEQRIIKFRAWDTYNERMIEEPEKFIPTGPHHYTDDPRFNAPFQYYETWQDIEDGVHRPCYIMQLTGLKDKNGKEIFEGDVLLLHDKVKLVVRFESGAYVLYHANPEYGRWGLLSRPYDYDFKDWRFVIIGNIYENPELIQLTQPA